MEGNEIIIPAAQQRDSKTIAVEIRMIHEQTQRAALQGSVEIGRRLVEAKSLVSHGDWGRWLQEEVSYSQSTADNFMKIFREYGPALEANSQAIQNLSYTKALKLLALPAEEREAFVAQNPVEDMSSRELENALRALKKEQAAKEKAEKRAQELEGSGVKAEQVSRELEALRKETNASMAAMQKKLDEATAEAGDLRMELAAERAKEPEVREVPADTSDLEAKLKAAEDALAEAKKQKAGANPDVAAFKALFEATQQNVNKMKGYILKLDGSSPEIADNLRKALITLGQAIQDAAKK